MFGSSTLANNFISFSGVEFSFFFFFWRLMGHMLSIFLEFWFIWTLFKVFFQIECGLIQWCIGKLKCKSKNLFIYDD